MDEKHIITEADLRTEAFLLAQPAERGTWVSIMAAATELGGNVIAGAGEWDERKTNALLGVRRRDLAKPTDLWWWRGQDLHVASAESMAPSSTPAPEPQQTEMIAGKMAAAGN